MKNRCKVVHSTVRITEFNALGVSVECTHCAEVFDIPAAKVEEDWYHFVHHSPRGEEKDIQVLIHFKVIE